MQTSAARPADSSDLAEVVRLVGRMFVALGTVANDEWAHRAEAALAERLWADVGVFVVDVPDAPDSSTLASVAVGIVSESLPSPRRSGTAAGYVEWVCTDLAHRGHGDASATTRALLEWFDARGVTNVTVHASAAAESRYRRIGFDSGGPIALGLRLHPVLGESVEH